MTTLFRNSSPNALTLDQAFAHEKKRLQKRREAARQAQELARHGRGEDSEVAHLARGEIVLPRLLQNPEVMAALARAAQAHNIPLGMLRVGNARNSINPNTGVAEFGWFKEAASLPERLGMKPDWTAARGEELFDPKYGPQWPAQHMSSAPQQPQTPNVIDDPNMMVSMKGQAIASLPTDPEMQKRAIARDLFPTNKYEEIADRFGEYNGRRYYSDFDGTKYYAEPEFKAPTSFRNMEQNVKSVVGLAGPAIPLATGAVGGFLTSPLAGSVYGGVVGTKLRSDLAERYAGEQKTGEQLRNEMINETLNQAAGGAVKSYLKRIQAWPRF